jgi:uncharacterized protein
LRSTSDLIQREGAIDGRVIAAGSEKAREVALVSLLRHDLWRMRQLAVVAALDLPDCWIGAGFVRSAVWDALHARPPSVPDGDVDVVWFDPAQASVGEDQAIEAALGSREPATRWSVKNQARMHARNDDRRYGSTADAVCAWPESATAIAVRSRAGDLDVLAPHGLGDLFDLIVRPTPAFADAKLPVVLTRVRDKRWFERWPLLRLAEPVVAEPVVGMP